LEEPGLPHWTLSARVDADQLEFSLGDGRRLAWRSRQPAALLERARDSLPAAELLGTDLAERLAQSAPRTLNVQFEAALDAVAWESLLLGDTRLAQQFVLGRQLISATEPLPALQAATADNLACVVVHCGLSDPDAAVRQLGLDALDRAWARDALAAAQVIVLQGVTPAQVQERARLPRHEYLLIVPGHLPAAQLLAALDAGAAVLALGLVAELQGGALDTLLLQLSSGASVGEAVRWLHRRAAPATLPARLYGDPGMRFVRAQAPTSRRQVTSLSFDVVGSTRMLQRLGDEAYADMLASLHARCTAVVRRHGGQPDAPQGNDGVMVYFGHPAALEDAAVRAVEAGLMIIRTVADLGVLVRVGIATGLVAIKDEQPVGLSIHLSARLQQVTAAGTVAVSASTQRLVARAFDLRVVSPRPELKGIEESEDVYLVLGPRQEAAGHRPEPRPGLAPLVGRLPELERLQACWRRAQPGGCCVVVVRADAGMGKSRLAREFRHQLLDAGVRVMELRCRADASSSPYLSLAESLRRWLSIGVDDSPAEALHKLAEALPPGTRTGEPLALLAALLGLAPQPSQAAPGGLRQRLLGLLLDWFTAFAKGRPCCLIVEDWHWVDPSTREFVEHLAQRRGSPGLLAVITTRGPPGPTPSSRGQTELIELAGLPPEDARELVRLVSAGAPLPAVLVRALAARGDGVPLFLEEAARMALELGTQSLEGAQAGAGYAVPASLQDLLMARLDGLGRAKQVAQVAAVCGREFSRTLLAALLESSNFAVDAVTLGEHLDTLVASSLVRPAGAGQFVFKHALVRDAAYASLWARDRHALHARMVDLLQQRWPELAALQPELLALHLAEAGLHTQALAQWELAASSAAARSAELEAISHLRRALGTLTHIGPGSGIDLDRTALRLQLLLAARLLATEGYGAEAVLQAYSEAERLCNQLGDETARFKVEMGLEAYRFMRADFGPALEHGRRAAAIAAQTGDVKQRLHAHWGQACTLFHQGDLRATMREMEAALALYSPALHSLFGIQDPGVMCLAYSSWALWELGRPDAALARINQAVAMAGEYEHKFSQAVALAYGVAVELLRGETGAALARVEVCIQVCEEAGFPVWLAIARCMRGRLRCEQGHFDSGLADMRAGYAMWLSTGAQVSQPLYLALQAEGLMLAGQWGDAAVCVEQGLVIADRFGERQLEAELQRLHGELALQSGDTGAAEDRFKRAYALAMRQHRLGFALRAATSLAGLWAGTARHEHARRLLLPLLARWQEGLGTRDLRAAQALSKTLG